MKKTIMILGAGILQLPAIQKAKEMGLRVIAVDIDKNAIGFQDSDLCLNISTIDIPAVTAAARKYKIDGIMTLASDMPVRTAAAVSEELNLAGITKETAFAATNKAIMRERLSAYKVPIPEFFRVNNFEEYEKAVYHFKNTCIVKPSDNSGSRGVFLLKHSSIQGQDIRGRKEVYEYSLQYARSNELMVEEYMEGPEVSVEAVSVEGRINILAITDKLTTGAPRFVEMGHSQPSRLTMDIQEKIRAVTKAAVDALGIYNGPSHTELIVTADGPKVVELGARLGGDHITSYLVPLSTGIDMVGSCIEIAMGGRPSMECRQKKGSAIRYFQTGEGVITDIGGLEEAEKIPGIINISLSKKIGDTVHTITNSTDRTGFVIAQSETAEAAVRLCEEAIQHVNIRLEPCQ